MNLFTSPSTALAERVGVIVVTALRPGTGTSDAMVNSWHAEVKNGLAFLKSKAPPDAALDFAIKYEQTTRLGTAVGPYDGSGADTWETDWRFDAMSALGIVHPKPTARLLSKRLAQLQAGTGLVVLLTDYPTLYAAYYHRGYVVLAPRQIQIAEHSTPLGNIVAHEVLHRFGALEKPGTRGLMGDGELFLSVATRNEIGWT